MDFNSRTEKFHLNSWKEHHTFSRVYLWSLVTKYGQLSHSHLKFANFEYFSITYGKVIIRFRMWLYFLRLMLFCDQTSKFYSINDILSSGCDELSEFECLFKMGEVRHYLVRTDWFSDTECLFHIRFSDLNVEIFQVPNRVCICHNLWVCFNNFLHLTTNSMSQVLFHSLLGMEYNTHAHTSSL